MKKLLKYSVLALALALGTSTYAHAETVTLAYGGTFHQILVWLFPWLASGKQSAQGKPSNPGKPLGNVAPEVDPSLALSAFALIGGTLTVMTSRRGRRQSTN